MKTFRNTLPAVHELNAATDEPKPSPGWQLLLVPGLVVIFLVMLIAVLNGCGGDAKVTL